MFASEELIQCDEVPKGLPHLLSIDGDHVVVHPVAYHGFSALRGLGLSDLTLVMGEDQVHATTVDVKLLAEILSSHSCALCMPAWEAFAPGAGPAHDMLGLRLLPEGKVQWAMLLILSIKRARIAQHVFDAASTQLSIVKALVILLYIEVDRSIALIGKACVKDLLRQGNLLNDVSRGHRLNAWREYPKALHRMMVADQVVLHHFHGLELLEACLLSDLILSLISVVLEMPDVSDVAYIAHLVA